MVMKHTSVESTLLVNRIIFTFSYHDDVQFDWQAATTGPLAKIAEHLQSHPENQLTSLENVNDLVFNQRKTFPHVRRRSLKLNYTHTLFGKC